MEIIQSREKVNDDDDNGRLRKLKGSVFDLVVSLFVSLHKNIPHNWAEYA